MNEIILNERSLQGQYRDMEEFLDCLPGFLRCVSYFMDREEWQILRRSDLFWALITPEYALYQIRGNRSDAARKFKGQILKLTDEPPYWDMEPKQCGCYMEGETDVSGSSLAEAAERTGFVLSFPKSIYEDCSVELSHEKETKKVYSITSACYRTQKMFDTGHIDIYTYLRDRYRGSRLSFEKFDPTYGFAGFEQNEIADCLESFERFAGHESWTSLKQDISLHYKEYRPSKQDNWFRGSDYEKENIHKFRCGNPKRCFGYREGDVFYVLRMERDHSISDKG